MYEIIYCISLLARPNQEIFIHTIGFLYEPSKCLCVEHYSDLSIDVLTSVMLIITHKHKVKMVFVGISFFFQICCLLEIVTRRCSDCELCVV